MSDHESVPPSPLPPSPRAPQPSLPAQARFPPGWVPAEDDVSLMAVDWRASTGLRVARRSEAHHERLAASVEVLSTTITAWQAEGARRWAVSGRIAWAVGIPVLVAVVLGALALAWRFVSTLHH